MAIDVYATGFFVGLSLIAAIGAQNAFVLRQGLRREHVLLVVLVCATSDAVLIAIGVATTGGLVRHLPWIDPALRWAGAAFLVWYGADRLRAAWVGAGGLDPLAAAPRGRRRALLTCLALTWLNPHVYVDTILLVGALSARFPGQGAWFGAGVATASATFFFALGYGATMLRPLFADPRAWRILDLLVAVTMGTIAVRLLAGA